MKALRLALLLPLLSLAGSPAWGQANRVQPGAPRIVIDEIDFFSPSAEEQANRRIAEIKKQFNKDVVTEAAKPPPAPKDLKKDTKAARNRFFDQYATRRYNELGVRGVYVLIIDNPKILRVETGRDTESKGYFTANDERDLLD